MSRNVLLLFVLSCWFVSGIGGVTVRDAEEKKEGQLSIVIPLFVDADTEPKKDRLGERITDVLRSEFIQDEMFRIVEVPELDRLVEGKVRGQMTDEEMRTIAGLMKKKGVDVLVLGEAAKFDDGVRVDVHLIRVQKEEILLSQDMNTETKTGLKDGVQALIQQIKQACGTETPERTERLQDGQYLGKSEGWPSMKVEVTVKDGKISQVKVLEDDSTPEFSSSVVETLPKAIVDAGTADVDVVSGATLSSNSLKQAVEEALEKAR